jgi:ABC-type uncharacterized transport system substrate-binding protein
MDGFTQQVHGFGSLFEVEYMSRAEARNATASLSEASLIVTLGEAVARELRKQAITAPTINALISKGEKNGAPNDAAESGRVFSLYIDQPPFRMASLVKAALPDVLSVTIGMGESTRHSALEIQAACKQLGLECETVLIRDSKEIENALELAARSDRVLMVLPDPLVINASTAKALILGAYMRGIALVGYSQALVKAGALMAVHSTPEQLGMDAANRVRDAMAGRQVNMPDRHYPEMFSVSINYQLARALRLDMRSEGVLEEIIKRAGRNE